MSDRFVKDLFNKTEREPNRFIGIVENTADPIGIGRVQVRVIETYGENPDKRRDKGDRDFPYRTCLDEAQEKFYQNDNWDIDRTEEEGIKSRNLPWAVRECPQKGSPPILSEGDRVWVYFRNGDINIPVVCGYLHTSPHKPSTHGALIDGIEKKNANPPFTERGMSSSIAMEAKAGNMVDSQPTITLAYKTTKGAVQFTDDRDGLEKSVQIDRAGQGITSFAPTRKDVSKAENQVRRGLRTPQSGMPIDREKIFRSRAGLEIMDIVQQGVSTDSRTGDEKVTIIAKQDVSTNKSGKDYILVGLEPGSNRFIVEGCENNQITSAMTIDFSTGVVRFMGKAFVIDTEHTIIKGNLSVLGKLSASEFDTPDFDF